MINKCQNHQLFNLPRVNGLKKTDSWCWFLPTDKQNASVIFVCEGWINLLRQWLTFYCVTWTRLCLRCDSKQESSHSSDKFPPFLLSWGGWAGFCLFATDTTFSNGQGVWYIFLLPVFFSHFPCITYQQYQHQQPQFMLCSCTFHYILCWVHFRS